jgi:chemotaxis response regulator CheB
VNAVIESDSGLSVALLGPADAAREQLRRALQGLGANLVFEGELVDADKLVRERLQPAVLIINLEPGVEDELDALQELLDHPETSVVFNEGEVSSQLTGWDLARWARHLAAKVLGVQDTLPPPPRGSEPLPTRDLLPEPGRPASPAQQQDHLDFDRFAGEVFQHQDEVPSSVRLDQQPEEAASPSALARSPSEQTVGAGTAPTDSVVASDDAGAGFDFDFSPVGGHAPQPEPEPAPSDNLDSMDLSEVFEQDLSQLSPDALLARLQQAMGLEPVQLPEDVEHLASASALQAARESLGLEPDAAGVAEFEAAPPMAEAADEQPVMQALDSQHDEAPALEEFDFGLDQVQAGPGEGPVLQGAMELEGNRLPEAIARSLAQSMEAPAGSTFDPVSAEFEQAFDAFEVEELSFDLPADSTAPAPSQGLDGDLEVAEFDFSVGDLGESEPGPSALPRRTDSDADDAALGGTLTFEGGADDEEIARLAAALDEAPSLPSTDELPPLEFDFSAHREPDQPPAGESAPKAPPDTRAGQVSRPGKGAGFGELSLTPMDQDFIDPSVQAPLAQPPERTFDFSALTLSLEPIEEKAPARPTEASAEGVATMRDGAWLRGLDEAPAPVPVTEPPAEPESEPESEQIVDSTPAVAVAPPPSVAPPLEEGVSRVIVLCASIGGPDAVRTFLAGIPEGFPAVFVVVQHLENGFFARLAQQLQKNCKLLVSVPAQGHQAADGQVLVVNAGERFLLATDGSVELAEPSHESRYRPCIDDVLEDIAEVFGANATAIIFSGMAADAVEGAVRLTQRGGEVWAQDPESCVVSSMVDGARARGVVEFIGSPRELAEYCVRRFGA